MEPNIKSFMHIKGVHKSHLIISEMELAVIFLMGISALVGIYWTYVHLLEAFDTYSDSDSSDSATQSSDSE